MTEHQGVEIVKELKRLRNLVAAGFIVITASIGAGWYLYL